MNKYISLLVIASGLFFACLPTYAQSGDGMGKKTYSKNVSNEHLEKENNSQPASIIHDLSSYPGLKKTDANLVGHVIDAKTKEHLPYINVAVKGTTIGHLTDQTGHYFLKNLPVGRFVVVFSSIGYKTLEVPFTFKKGETRNLKVALKQDAVALDGVVVSANRNATKRRLAPALVNVVSLETFENTNSPTLAEGLHFQPGVRVETDCQNCGFTQVRINGMDGPYTQILMDSRAIFSALTGVYGLEQIPATMVERIEVMRGGSSALFGASAIAGTINIITKEPIRNSGSLSHNITSIDRSGSFDNQTSLNLSLVTDDHKAGIYLFGQNRKRSGYDYDGDSYTEVPELESTTLGFRSYLKTSDYSKLTVEYHHLGEQRRGGNKLSLPPHMADLCESIKHSIDGGGVTFDLFSPSETYKLSIYGSAQNTDRDSYYSGYGHTKGLSALAGAQYSYNFDKLWFMPATFTGGTEYSYESLEDESFEYDHSTDQKVNIASAYAQNEWKNDKWSLLVGARMDKHHFIDHVIVSPRANIRYNPSENINFRLGYSEGFRAPQAFDEDLHIGNVSERVSIIELDPNLKEERSSSWSLSADTYGSWGSWSTNFMIDAFYTQLSDAFILKEIGETDQFLINQRTNGAGAKVWGVNLEVKMAYRRLFSMQVGATLQRSMYDEKTTWSDDESLACRKMTRTPDVYGYMMMNYNPTKKLTIGLNGTYTGSMLVPHASISSDTQDQNVDSPEFFELGSKISYDIDLGQTLEVILSLGVNNVFDSYQDDFDQGSNRDSGYIYGPSLPRTYFMGCKINF